MQYTEEHYAQLYNDLPEGLKDLVLSGRLAILVSAIGSRHGLNADQVADLEPAIEDVCLGLITKDELVENILKNVQVDQRVANRIAAEAELEILKPFEAELIVSRKQKEDLDSKIVKDSGGKKKPGQMSAPVEPQDVSGHAEAKKVSEWYSKDKTVGTEGETENAKNIPSGGVSFDWDKDFAAKAKAAEEAPKTESVSTGNLESKLDVLTESINKLVNVRFGEGEKKDSGISEQMQELLKRLEKAEKENEENKKLIRSLQGSKPTEAIFGENAVKIDKQRKVDINHTEPKPETGAPTGNIQITSVSKPVPIEKTDTPKQAPIPTPQPIISSSVSKDTLDSIVETRNKETPLSSQPQISTKKSLSLDELIKGDTKIKEATSKAPMTGTMTFPGMSEEKKVDIKNVSQKENLRQTLLDDIEYLKGSISKSEEGAATSHTEEPAPQAQVQEEAHQQAEVDPAGNVIVPDQVDMTQAQPSSTYASNPFKDELMPKTKEERMKALQDKIKALNKGVSVGGKTNISASGLDPYKL